MRKRLPIPLLAAFLSCAPAYANAQVNHHFFPTRPAHITKLYYAVGTLLDYGSGNDTAGLAIRDERKRLVPFVLAFPHTIDGKRYTCNNAPEPGIPRDLQNCPQWPHDVVLRKTRVRVTYWWQRSPSGELVKVSDAMTVEP